LKLDWKAPSSELTQHFKVTPQTDSAHSAQHLLLCLLHHLKFSFLQDADENKLCYMQLFEAYCTMLEGSIQRMLQGAVPGLSMEDFAAMLEERQGQLGAEVREQLHPRTLAAVSKCSNQRQACSCQLGHTDHLATCTALPACQCGHMHCMYLLP
jgi:hypothetical protein